MINFIEELEKYCSFNHSKELKIWCAFKENRTGDDYKKEIRNTIERSPIFLMVLEPDYITNNPETLEEVQYYRQVRSDLKEEENFLSVIRWRGNKEAEIKHFINGNLIVSYFSK